MKVLFISNQFPDAAHPIRGLDNARLVFHLTQLCQVRVIAPRPTLRMFFLQPAKPFRCCPGDEVLGPEFPAVAYLPKIGSRFNHRLMARSLRASLERIRPDFPFDIVLAAWVYPDACAVAALAREFGFPFVAVAQGSDVHQYLPMPGRRKIILTVLQRASGVIGRSAHLARLLCAAGVSPEKMQVIYNGVDFALFHPGDRAAARKDLGLPPDVPVILYVGNFLPVKNPLLLVAAHQELRHRSNARHHLVMVGDGPLRDRARRLARGDGAENCTLLVGQKSPAEVARYLQAADVLCVPSNNEGVPNVIRQAFACGLPVVATNVGGIPEVVNQDFAGRLVEPANRHALACALAERLAEKPDPNRIIDYARQFSWENAAKAYFDMLAAAC